MEQLPLSVSPREDTGKGTARKLRQEGKLPAVIYGSGVEPKSLSVVLSDLEKLLRKVTGSTAFLSLSIEGEDTRTAVLQEIQRDHLGREVLHVDFLEVQADKPLNMEIPLNFTGEPKGAAMGGVINTSVYSVVVTGVIADIPDVVDVDLTELEIGDSLNSADLNLPEGVTITAEEDFLIAACYEPAQVVEEEPEEGEEGEEGEEATEGGEEESAKEEG